MITPCEKFKLLVFFKFETSCHFNFEKIETWVWCYTNETGQLSKVRGCVKISVRLRHFHINWSSISSSSVYTERERKTMCIYTLDTLHSRTNKLWNCENSRLFEQECPTIFFLFFFYTSMPDKIQRFTIDCSFSSFV